MKNKKKTRRIAIVLACILIPLGAFGFGYFTANKEVSNQVAHTLTVNGDITGSITKDVDLSSTGMVPGDEVEATVNIQPKSTADSLLRVKVEPYWMKKGKDGQTLDSSNLELIEDSSVVKSDRSENSWYEEGGYYYFINKVDSNTKEISLIKGLKFKIIDNDNNYDANDYQDNSAGIKVTMEMVQCNGRVYKTKWKSDTGSELSLQLINVLDVYSKDSKTITTVGN